MEKTEERPWVLVALGGRTLVGQFEYDADKGHDYLRPVYDFNAGPVPLPEGGFGINYQATPFCWLTSLRELRLPGPDACIIIRLDTLARFEESGILAAVRAMEEQVQKMRAQAAGITIAKVGGGAPPPRIIQ